MPTRKRILSRGDHLQSFIYPASYFVNGLVGINYEDLVWVALGGGRLWGGSMMWYGVRVHGIGLVGCQLEKEDN